MFTKLLNIKKNYIVFWIATVNYDNGSSKQATGNTNIITEGLNYFQLKAVKELIKSDHKDYSLDNIVLTNVIQLSKRQYQDYIKC